MKVTALDVLSNTICVNGGIGRFIFRSCSKNLTTYVFRFAVEYNDFETDVVVRYKDGHYLVNEHGEERQTRTDFDTIIYTMYTVLESSYEDYNEEVRIKAEMVDMIKKQLKEIE